MLHFWNLSNAEPALISLVGGGGKTSVMVALAKALVANGRSVIATTTTRIFSEQMALAPAALTVTEAQTNKLPASLATYGWCLVVAQLEGEKAQGVALEQPGQWLARPDVDVVIVEADGSRMLPFKVPAAHEPPIPPDTTLVVPVVGVTAVNGRIATTAHRPERVLALSPDATPDSPLTPSLIARLLTHPQGGLKNVPPTARVMPFINQVETAEQFQLARQIATHTLQSPQIDAVLIGAVQSETPVLERHDRITAVILAAGESKRMGRATKQLLPWGQTTVLGQTIANTVASGVHETIVVTGHEVEKVQAIAQAANVSTIYNPQYASGDLLSSLKTAVAHLPPHCQAILVMLADQPLIEPETINQILSAYWRGEGDLVAPTFKGIRGHPVLIGRAYFDELLALANDSAPRNLLRHHLDQLHLVPVASESILIDLDRPEDYQRYYVKQ